MVGHRQMLILGLFERQWVIPGAAESARNFVSKGDRGRATRFGIVINVEDKEGLEHDTTIAPGQWIETVESAAANIPKGKTLRY